MEDLKTKLEKELKIKNSLEIQIKSLKEQINKDEIRLYDLKKKIKGYLNCTIIKMEIDNKQFIKLINEEKHFTKGKIFRIFNECLTGE